MIDFINPPGNRHEDHPGHDAADCPLRITINAVQTTTSNGYACRWTGGHCLPGADCGDRVEAQTEIDQQRELQQELERELAGEWEGGTW